MKQGHSRMRGVQGIELKQLLLQQQAISGNVYLEYCQIDDDIMNNSYNYSRIRLSNCKCLTNGIGNKDICTELGFIQCSLPKGFISSDYRVLSILHIEECNDIQSLNIDNCPSLEILKVTHNPSLTHLSLGPNAAHLCIADLRSNSITEMPQLPSLLKELELANNCISVIESSHLGHLTRLEVLNLEGNKDLCELPHVLWDLVNLTTLNLNGTGIGAIPSRISRLKRLRNLDLAGIPTSFGALPLLEIAVTGTTVTLMHSGPPHPSMSGRTWWDMVRELPPSGLWNSASLDNAELREVLWRDMLVWGMWNPRVHRLYDFAMRTQIETLWLIAFFGPDEHPVRSLPREILIKISAYITALPIRNQSTASVAPVDMMTTSGKKKTRRQFPHSTRKF